MLIDLPMENPILVNQLTEDIQNEFKVLKEVSDLTEEEKKSIEVITEMQLECITNTFSDLRNINVLDENFIRLLSIAFTENKTSNPEPTRLCLSTIKRQNLRLLIITAEYIIINYVDSDREKPEYIKEMIRLLPKLTSYFNRAIHLLGLDVMIVKNITLSGVSPKTKHEVSKFLKAKGYPENITQGVAYPIKNKDIIQLLMLTRTSKSYKKFAKENADLFYQYTVFYLSKMTDTNTKELYVSRIITALKLLDIPEVNTILELSEVD